MTWLVSLRIICLLDTAERVMLHMAYDQCLPQLKRYDEEWY